MPHDGFKRDYSFFTEKKVYWIFLTMTTTMKIAYPPLIVVKTLAWDFYTYRSYSFLFNYLFILLWNTLVFEILIITLLSRVKQEMSDVVLICSGNPSVTRLRFQQMRHQSKMEVPRREMVNEENKTMDIRILSPMMNIFSSSEHIFDRWWMR